jgi:hypothetical protein
MVAELTRRGLPPQYALRAVSELADHHRDLVEELQAVGWSDEHATLEASRRLGEPRALVKKTVREYQRRYWCGRWPLITFVLGPIPAVLAMWIATALAILCVPNILALGFVAAEKLQSNTSADQGWMSYVVAYGIVTWCLFAVPALVTLVFARLARRAALGIRWVAVVVCILGLSIGAVRFQHIGASTALKVFDKTGQLVPENRFMMALPLMNFNSWREMSEWYIGSPLQPFQVCLPAIVAALILLRSRQQSIRAQQIMPNGC